MRCGLIDVIDWHENWSKISLISPWRYWSWAWSEKLDLQHAACELRCRESRTHQTRAHWPAWHFPLFLNYKYVTRVTCYCHLAVIHPPDRRIRSGLNRIQGTQNSTTKNSGPYLSSEFAWTVPAQIWMNSHWVTDFRVHRGPYCTLICSRAAAEFYDYVSRCSYWCRIRNQNINESYYL